MSVESACVRTNIALDWEGGKLTFKVAGDKSLLPEMRTWNVECIGFEKTEVTAAGKNIPVSYDKKRNALCFTLETNSETDELCVCLGKTAVAQDDWLARVDDRLMGLQTSPDEKETIWKLLGKRGRTLSAMTTLRALCATDGLADALEEVIFAQE